MTRFGMITALAIVAAASPLHAGASDPYAYKFVLTPEDGQVDPAINARYTKQLDACQKKAVATPDIADCFEDEFKRQDAALNVAWKAALQRVGPRSSAQLIAAERRWVAARDPFCSKASDQFKGGTIMPIVYSSCRVEETIRRTMWLEKLR